MKTLIAEDDSTSRKILEKLLSVYGVCDVAENGNVAVDKFKSAVKGDDPYDLVCLDIMMPEKDGQEALQDIRKAEEENGISGPDEVKIIMVTALTDPKTVVGSLKEGATAYMAKPLNRKDLKDHLRNFGLV